MCFFSLLPTLFPLGRGPFASLARVTCLKKERLRWGSPTATAPFEPLNLGLCALVILAVKRGSILCSLYLWIPAYAGMTGESLRNPVPELVEGPHLHLSTVAHASGSECSVFPFLILLLLPCLCFCVFPCHSVANAFFFSKSLLPCHSVANASASASVFFRG